MKSGFQPALFLFQRFILGPSLLAFLVSGGWALVSRHWLSAALLLAACLLAAVLLVRLPVGKEQPIQSEFREPMVSAEEQEAEVDDSGPLATAIVRMNLLLCVLLMGLVWSEHLPLMKLAVFVVLFSILFPAGAALFCIVGEQMMRAHRGKARTVQREPPSIHGLPGAH